MSSNIGPLTDGLDKCPIKLDKRLGGTGSLKKKKTRQNESAVQHYVAQACQQCSSLSTPICLLCFVSAQILSPHFHSWIMSISSPGAVCCRFRRRLNWSCCRQSIRSGESQSAGQQRFLQRGWWKYNTVLARMVLVLFTFCKAAQRVFFVG